MMSMAKMRWPIIDRGGFGDLRIGDPREAVRQRFGEYSTVRADADRQDATETDRFGADGGLKVGFGPDGRVCRIELAAPFDPTVRGVQLMGRPVSRVADQLLEHGIDYVADPDPAGAGGAIIGWDVHLYVRDQVVEGVTIGPVTTS